MARLAPSISVIRRLFALSGNECAFPECKNKLINSKGQFIGQVCHIEAANEQGERYNADQSDEDRRSFDNLVLFCYEHHVETNDTAEFTVSRLKEIKSNHESKFTSIPYSLPENFAETILSNIQASLGKLYEISIDTNERVKQLQSSIAEFAILLKPAVVEESIYLEQLDTIRELRKQKKHKTAIDLLLQYKDKNWNNLTGEVKYKVIANLGISYFELNQNKKGAEMFLETEKIDYESEDSLGYLALSYAILDDAQKFEKAFEKSIRLNPENINAWIGYIYIQEPNQTDISFIDRIPEKLKNKLEILYALGEYLLDSKHLEQGLGFLSKALDILKEKDETTWPIEAAIASKILQSLVTPFKFVFKHFTERELILLNECIHLLSNSWEKVKNTELEAVCWYLLMNRGITYKITGRYDDAMADLERAFELTKDFKLVKNLFVLYLEIGKTEKAKKLLSSYDTSVLNENDLFEFRTFQARLLCSEGNQEQAAALLSEMLYTDNTERKLILLTLIIVCYTDCGRYKDALVWAEKQIELFPDKINGYSIAGFCHQRLSQREAAIARYNEACDRMETIESEGELDALASGFMELSVFDKAAVVYAKIYDPNIWNLISQKLIYCYYNNGDIQQALVLAKKYHETRPGEPFLAEMLFNIYQETGNYNEAIEVLNKFLITESPHHDFFLLKGAMLHYHLDETDKLKKLIERIKHPLEFSLNHCFKLCYFLRKTGEYQKAVDIAYKARAKYYDSENAHSKYLQLLSMMDAVYTGDMFPERVRNESVVLITDESGKQHDFLISDEQSPGVSNMRPSDEFAQKLINQPLNAEVTVEKKGGARNTFRIVGILDKYTYAYRKSLELVDTKFSPESEISVFHAVGENSFDKIIQFIKQDSLERDKHEKLVYDYYKRKQATIEVMANVQKMNIVKKWFQVVGSDEISLLAFARDESGVISFSVENNTPIVIDIIALLTLFFVYPDHLLIHHISAPLYVTQSTIDKVNEFLRELDDHKGRDYETVSYEGGKLVRSNLSAEGVARHKELLTELVSWCKQNTIIKAPAKTLELTRSEREYHVNIIGECSYENILLAQEVDGFILSDDENYKNLIQTESQIPSFSSYQLAVYLFTQKKITDTILIGFVEKLILFNYTYIPVTVDLLWKCFDKSGFQMHKPFTVAVKGLLILHPKFLVLSVVGFAKNLYLNTGLFSTREQVIHYILGELRHYRQFDLVKKGIELLVEREFAQLQKAKDDFLDILSHY